MKKLLIGLSCIMFLLVGVGGFALPDVHALNEETAAYVEEARAALKEITDEKVIMALVYLSDEYPIRLEPFYDSAVVQVVRSGQQVQIKDVHLDDNLEVWSYVTLYYGEQELAGFIPRNMLACSDMDFLVWEDTYGMNPAGRNTLVESESGELVYADIEVFPESYKEALLSLKTAHPNWTFVKMDTGLDWTASVNAQMQGGRSLVPDSYPDYMKEGVYGAGWSYAAENILSYHLDPRNFLKESTIFQFELLTYNDTYHTVDAVQLFLDNTFMKGKPQGFDITYAQIIQAHGKDLGISPFHMSARIYQEQGNGTSELISGTYEGLNGTLKGYYNFFNVQATGATREEIIINGLTYAKNAKDVKDPTKARPWTDAYWSIQGGAYLISSNYILKGQDTLYLQKFNVNPTSPYGVHNHQYMQNIVAPQSEGKNIRKLYRDAGSLENTFVFKIPVFLNMPETAVPYPTDPTPIIESFVTRMYQQCLFRNPDEAGLDGWVYQLLNGYMDGADIAEQFVFSEEMFSKNLSNGDFVDVLYRAMIGREADENGKAGWVYQLDNHNMTRSEVTKAFVESTEFTDVCSDYGIIRGTYDASISSVERFVDRLCMAGLENNPTQKEFYGWVNGLANQTMYGADIVEEVIFSDEILTRDLSNADFVDLLYTTLFNRRPDQSGKSGWVYQLDNHNMTRSEVTKVLAAGEEFAGVCSNYGVTPGTYDSSIVPLEIFVTRFYTLCLEREPDQLGLYGWVSNLKNQYMNGAQIAEQFFFGVEFIDKNVSDEVYVELLYNTLMGRAADAEGKSGWLYQLDNGFMTREDVMKSFIESSEFTGICGNYGITRGSLE